MLVTSVQMGTCHQPLANCLGLIHFHIVVGMYQDELGGVKISKADRQRLMLKSAASKGQGII